MSDNIPVPRQRLRIPPEYAGQLRAGGRVDAGSLTLIYSPEPRLNLPSIILNPIEHNKLPLFLSASRAPPELPWTSLCTSVSMTGKSINFLPDLGYQLIVHVNDIITKERHVTRFVAEVGAQCHHTDTENHFRCASRLYFEDEAYALVFLETVAGGCQLRPSSGALMHVLTYMLQQQAEVDAKERYERERK